MQNIIRNELSLAELTAVFSRNPPIPLLPPLGDAAWRKTLDNPVIRPLIDQIRAAATTEIDRKMPPVTADDYADFHQNGGRRHVHEQKYFERRRQLGRAGVAALTETDASLRQRLLDSTLAKIRETFAEPSWAFPAHTTDPSGIEPMTIDLFAAETANLFGELLTLFPRIIPADFSAEIKKRLNTQFFQNYIDHPPHWTTYGMNWNAVCHQGVLGAALAVSADPEQLATLFQRAAKSLTIFLSGFTADGGSSEGPGYWGYGFGWMAELNRQLETRTNGELSLVDGDQHAHNIARFGPKMTLSNGWAVNFSDNGPRTAPRPALLAYLAERFDDSDIRAHALVGYARAAAGPMDLNSQRNDLQFYTQHLLHSPTDLTAATSLPDTDVLLPDLGVIVLRFHDRKGRLWEFAGKAGNNAEHHNHNDVGSYLLNIDGFRFLTEIGAPLYTKAFFGPERYTFIATRSKGHPVPLIAGHEQPSGPEFRGEILSHQFTPQSASVEIDLTQAYPCDAGCRCIRQFRIDKSAGTLTITDTFEMAGPREVESAVISESPTTLDDGIATIVNGPVTLRIKPIGTTQIREVQKLDFITHDNNPSHIHRIVLVPTGAGRSLTIGCVVEIV